MFLKRLLNAGLRRITPFGRRPPPAYPEQFDPAMDLAPPSGPTRIYLIATTPRCGSHYVGHALAGTGHFGVPLEYLHPGALAVWHERFGSARTEDALARLIDVRSGPTGLFGLKAHWSHFETVADGALFAPHGGLSRAVWIWRRDLLGQAISFLIAGQTGQWISGAAARGPARYDYAAIVERARRVAEQNLAWAEYFADHPETQVLQVVYEDLRADPSTGFARVATFLDPGSDHAPRASARTRPQAGRENSDWHTRFCDQVTDADRWILDPQDWGGARNAGA